jgi:hypothetical protein
MRLPVLSLTSSRDTRALTVAWLTFAYPVRGRLPGCAPSPSFLTDRSSAGYALAFVPGGAAPRRRDITA